MSTTYNYIEQAHQNNWYKECVSYQGQNLTLNPFQHRPSFIICRTATILRIDYSVDYFFNNWLLIKKI